MTTISLNSDGGVTKRILKEGESGIKAPSGTMVNVHYVGKFPEGGPRGGEIFDSSRRKGREFRFALGQGMVIQGWDIGVASMERGELCVLTCQAPYAYGERGAGNGLIPANATLEFEVEFIGYDGEPPRPGGQPGATAPKCTLA